MKIAALIVVSLVCNAAALARKTKLDINQKAYIEGQAVLGDGAGQGVLNTCMGLADHFITVASKPAVKVCGNGIKMTVYLLGRCGEGSLTGAHLAHTWVVGACDTGSPPSTCASFAPADDQRMGAAQSYKITQC